MRKGLSAALAAVAALAFVRETVANNNWNTSYRGGTISLPSSEESSSNRATGVAINQGRVGYSVPIEAPPGFRGMSPELAIQYTGSRSEGALGAQWTIGGVPSLSVRTSGRGGQPIYGTGVTYLGFSGEELVPIDSAGDIDGDGTPDTTYREQRDRLFARYIERSTGGWRIDYPDGRKLTLGTSSANRIARQDAAYANQIWTWLPETLEDAQGNQLLYQWADAATVLGDPAARSSVARYLTEVRYACRSCAAATSYQRVAFTYAARATAGAAPVLDMRPGFLVEWEAYLTGVDTYTHTAAGTRHIRRYDLTYTPAAGRLLLASVATTGDDGTTLPAINFTYTDNDAPASPASTVASVPQSGGVPIGITGDVFPADMDGDGRIDLVKCQPVGIGTYRWWRNTGNGTAAFDPVGSTYASPPGVCPATGLAVSEEDGDRDLDIDFHNYSLAAGGVEVYELVDATVGWASAGFAIVSTSGSGDNLTRTDANRDGYVDLVTTGAWPWKVSFDDSTYDYTLDEVECDGTNGVGITPMYGISVLGTSSPGVLITDVTGDEVPDTLYVEITSPTASSGSVHIWPGRGRGCFGFLAEDGHGASAYSTTPIAAFAQGISWVLPDAAALQAADVNGDGLDDLVWLDDPGDRIGVWILDPNAGFVPTYLVNQPMSTSNRCVVVDLEGDGASNILCSQDWKLYDFADQQAQHLETVANGRGAVTTISYTTSSRMAATAEQAGAPWATNVAASMPFANLLTIDDGRSGREVRSFVARDAYYKRDTVLDVFEIVGFGYIEETRTAQVYTGTAWLADAQDPGSKTRTWYDVGATTWALRGATTCQETWRASARPATYTCGASTGALVRNQYTYLLAEDSYGVATITTMAADRYVLEGSANGPRIRTEQQFDDLGNEISNIAWGVYKAGNPTYGGDEMMTVTDWITDRSSWQLRSPKRVLRGRPTSSTTAPVLAIESATFSYYDGSSTWDVATLTTGLRTQTRKWTCDPTLPGDPGCAVPGDDTYAVTTEQVQYTAEGMASSVTDADNVITATTYDSDFGLFLTSKTLDPGGLNLATTFATDSAHGGYTAMTGPDGQTTRAAYDSLGRMIVIAKPGDSLAKPTIVRTFVDGAPVSAVVDVAKDGTANGLAIATVVDAHGRLLCRTREGATAGQVHVELQKEWSALGNLVAEAVPYDASRCNPFQITTAARLAARTLPTAMDSFAVDALGRRTRLMHSSDGSQQTWTYGALQVSHRDEETNAGGVHAAKARVHYLDGQGRVIRSSETHQYADVDPGTHSFTFGYTFDGQVERVTSSTGAVIHTATYDSLRRLVRTVDATRGTTSMTYDAVGRVATTTDARGEVINYTYDNGGRIETATDSAGTTTYQYDTHPVFALTGTCHSAGRLARVTYPAGETTYCYDQRGRTQSETAIVHSLGASSYQTAFTYDALDRLKTVLFPDLTRALYSYGNDGFTETMTAWSGTGITHRVVSDVDYTAWGAPKRIVLGNGAVLAYEFDGRARPERSSAQSSATAVQDLELTLDLVGNVLAIADGVGFSSATYGYDDLYRLVSATGARYGGETATYEYDRLGNLTRKSFSDPGSPLDIGALTYAHPTIPTAVTSAVGQTFSYDAMGNMTGDGTFTFSYTPTGALREALDAGGVTKLELEYDHSGRRIAKLGSGNTVHYFSGAELRSDGATSTWHKYFQLAGRAIARFDGTFTLADVGDHIFYYATDHLGSPTAVMNTSGATVERYDHHPHGEESVYSLEAADAAAGTTEFTDTYFAPGDPASKLTHRFQGREVDDQLAMYNFGARIYRPDLGRFMTADSIVPSQLSSQSWNRHAFVRNNPLAFTDPSGHADHPVTVDSPDVDYWVKDMLDDVGGSIPHGYNIAGLQPLRQFAMNYLDDARDTSNDIEMNPTGFKITKETSFAGSTEIDAVFRANMGVSTKQMVDGYQFVYSYTNADGNLVTKSLTLDPGKWRNTNTVNGSVGMGFKFKLGDYGGGGVTTSLGGIETKLGAYKNVEGMYTSRFLTLERAYGGSAWKADEYAPDPAYPTTRNIQSHTDGLRPDPQMMGGWCPGNCHEATDPSMTSAPWLTE